jgi:hypothetical protein
MADSFNGIPPYWMRRADDSSGENHEAYPKLEMPPEPKPDVRREVEEDWIRNKKGAARRRFFIFRVLA